MDMVKVLTEFVWCYEHQKQSKTLVQRIRRLAKQGGVKLETMFDLLGFSLEYAKKEGWL